MKTNAVSRIAETIIRFRIAILVTMMLMLAAAITGVPRFKIAASADTLLAKDNALYIQSQLAQQTFNPDEFILVAYEPTGHDVFSEQTFSDLQRLSEDFRSIARVESVTSIINVPLIKDAAALTGETQVSQLTWQAQQYDAETMRSLIADHPIFTDLLINKANTATAIQIVFETNEELARLERDIIAIKAQYIGQDIPEEAQAQLDALEQQADPIRQSLTNTRKEEIAAINQITQAVSERANIYLGGPYVVGQHLIDIITRDLVVFGAAIVLVIALLLLLLYRRLRWVLFPLTACAVSVGITVGLLGWLDLRATVISANFVALQIILTLAVMIHMISSYRHIAREQPESHQHERVRRVLQAKLAPCFFAALTTSVGFAALLFSGLAPVMSFGTMMLLATSISLLVSVIGFPAGLACLTAKTEGKEWGLFSVVLNRAATLSFQRPGCVSVIAASVLLVLSAGITRLNVENSFINYFADDTRVHQELAYIDKEFGGTTALDIIINIQHPPSDPALLLSANSVNQLQIVQTAVNAFEATGSVTSVANFTALAKQLNNGKPLTEYELSSIYYLLDQKVVNQLVGAYFSPEKQQLRMATRIQDTTEGLDREQFMFQLRQDMQAVSLDADDYQLTGLFVLYQDILARLFDSQITTLGIVYVALGAVFLLIFRSIPLALIALVPNILTTLAILGIIGWAGIPLDIMTITIAAIAMGIAVDDTLHFVHSYREANQEGAEKATRHAFRESGLAILITTSLIAIGFSLFAWSDFLPSVYFGLLTALAMLLALVADMTLLPALLNVFVGKQENEQMEDVQHAK